MTGVWKYRGKSTDYNTPYLFAISFVLLIGLLEIFALICGHMLSGALDAHLDHY
ncbi:DUF1449 family protein, partial [Escherichia coli]|nr:DUF1449 family protein [Escherichia coli]